MKDPCEPDQGNRELTTRVSEVTQNLREVGTTKHYAEEHEVHTRQSVEVKWRISLKPKTDTERQEYATVMSVKEVRVYPGRCVPKPIGSPTSEKLLIDILCDANRR